MDYFDINSFDPIEGTNFKLTELYDEFYRLSCLLSKTKSDDARTALLVRIQELKSEIEWLEFEYLKYL